MKKRTNIAIAISALVLSCTGFVGLTANNPHETEYVYVPPMAVKNTDPFMMRSVKCSDYDNKVEPCWTLSKGRFSLILSWYPKKEIRLSECTSEDGGNKLPCIWRDNNKQDKKSDPVTRNIFWKGDLK